MTEPKPPADCADMADLRRQIDRLDAELVRLLTLRAGYIDRAVQLKAANDLPARIPERVEQVIGNARTAAQSQGLDPELADALWRILVDWSIAREARTIRET